MYRRKFRGGAKIGKSTTKSKNTKNPKNPKNSKNIGEINPVERSKTLNAPAVPTPMTTWEKIKKFARDNKLISRGLKAVGTLAGDKYNPLFSAGSSLAESYGYGRRRKPKMTGGASNKVVRF